MALKIVRDASKAARMSLERLAAEVDISVSQMSRIERGLRQPTLDQVKRLSTVLDIPLEEFGDISAARKVKLVGFVSAGSVAVLYSEADDPDEWVEAPDGATERTVAAEIRGTSLGELFDRWLVFYDDLRERPSRSLLNKLCIVGLADGRVVVKKLTKGQLPGRYTLVANTEPPIYDAAVIWAARIKHMTPR
jgi:transcriptional regulator with XRE-family HTH domain